ncbi:MAG: tetratricopeptide repeat protein [Holophagales bacterium]|nr:tetratricopeptide repeat protein [Holophagales bacterium]
MTAGAKRGSRFLAAACALIAVGGCATGALRNVLESNLRIQIRERGIDPATVELPFELTPAMREWARKNAGAGGSPEVRLERLLQALIHREGKTLVYESGHTGTAQEVWESGRANCLAFTHLYVGMAREVGLPVYYLRVGDIQSFEKDGNLVIVSEHITAAWGSATNRRVLDFSDRPVTPYHAVEPIPDLTAVALYYSNRGAERIRAGDSRGAFALLDLAVRLDPELADGWVNYGVAVRRLARAAEAEVAFRRALELDPEQVSAYQNLAALLSLTGRESEAADLLAVADRSRNRNPFSYVALGDLSFEQGRLDEAERFYRRAVRLDPEQAEPLAALGQWAVAAGKDREARSLLKRAERADPENPRVLDLARQIRPPSPI